MPRLYKPSNGVYRLAAYFHWSVDDDCPACSKKKSSNVLFPIKCVVVVVHWWFIAPPQVVTLEHIVDGIHTTVWLHHGISHRLEEKERENRQVE